KTIFLFFEQEYAASIGYFPKSIPTVLINNIKAYDWYKFDEENQTHLDERRVIVNPATADYKCSYHLFDSHGWLCRHILKTMDHVMLWENKDARTIPSKYLKVRWRKTAKVGVDFVIQFGGETDPDSEVSRYHELMSMFSVLALESAPLVETTNMAK
ncbi:Protein FAR1-RELATED SEQUENCE 12, partial [Linum perenne]